MSMDKSCYSTALKLLTRRDYSEYELRKKLKEKGFENLDINEVSEKMKRLNYIDDQRYMEGRIRYYLKSKKGPHYIIKKCEELKLPISEERIEEQREDLNINVDDHILHHVSKKLTSMRLDDEISPQDKTKIKSKIQMYLSSKGHKVFDISKYLKELNYEI